MQRRPTAKRPTLTAPASSALLAAVAAAAISTLAFLAPARALEEPKGEADALKACEKKLCTMVLEKQSKGDDLDCKLSKTWVADTIKGGESKTVKWGFGDASCQTKVTLSRADVIAALTQPKHTVSLSNQTVRCVVERSGEPSEVRATASPRLDFKNGRADKVWINLREIDGPTDIKGTIWTAANLEDSIGIFHRSMIKSINKFLFTKCLANYGPAAKAKEQKDKAKAERKAKGAKEASAEGATAKADEGEAKKSDAKPATAAGKAADDVPEASRKAADKGEPQTTGP